ncbi:spore maturation protein [Lacrimispora sp. NSJ-141]|uniref:Spore maturation protein n=2 Tax=Lachnospiraceae TaxID=186803 RepID=A0A7G9G633_9FIRM|nr:MULTISPECIES: nucleoside recognition domain-containing protein [Lachnospiraceae]MCD2493578.1 spore maturation protein [Lientehia hominis]QNM06265.1 spore maturation protein [Qiania dongpingensis]
MIYFSNLLIPMVVCYIAVQGLLAGRPIFEDFIRGAKDGLKTVAGILPTLVGLMIGTGVLRASGFLDTLAVLLSKIISPSFLPSQVLPVILVKLFSSSAATGLALDIFKEFGPDSLSGRMVSIILSCTETVFYTMSVYFMSVKIKKTRHTLPGALLATFVGIIVSVVLAVRM